MANPSRAVAPNSDQTSQSQKKIPEPDKILSVAKHAMRAPNLRGHPNNSFKHVPSDLLRPDPDDLQKQ